MRCALVIILISICMTAGGGARAEDFDIQAITRRIAQQDARIRDMEAKNTFIAREGYGGAATDMTSLRKNAVVTMGGLVTTGYYFRDVSHREADGGSMILRKSRSHRGGAPNLTDANLFFDIQVGEHFDAFLKLDLQNSSDDFSYDMSEVFWVRWKNIANTGWGVKVGRDELVFGTEGHGYLDGWVEGPSDGMGALSAWYWPHQGRRKIKGVVQVTPYWESAEGTVLAELSFMQNVDTEQSYRSWTDWGYWIANGTGYRSSNYGLGTMSARLTWKPVEGLKLTASAANFINRFHLDSPPLRFASRRDARLYGLSFDYRPSWLNRLNTWGQWLYSVNAGGKGRDSHVFNFGLSWDWTDRLTTFIQGDYFHRTEVTSPSNDFLTIGNAVYGGVMYSLRDGLTLEAGWRHEFTMERRNLENPPYTRYDHTKTRANTVYANVGLEF